jgi:hypothetical protein
MRRAFALVGLAMIAGLFGCSPIRDHMCQPGEYPVWSQAAPATGRLCVTDGQEPPRGFARYPAGHVPTYVDEDYDPASSPSPK